MDLDDVNSLEETAAYLKISPEVLRRMARMQKIGGLKIGAKWVFPRGVIETFVQHQTKQQILPHPSGMTESSLRRLRAERRPGQSKW